MRIILKDVLETGLSRHAKCKSKRRLHRDTANSISTSISTCRWRAALLSALCDAARTAPTAAKMTVTVVLYDAPHTMLSYLLQMLKTAGEVTQLQRPLVII